MDTSKMMMHTQKAASLLRLVIGFMDTTENDEGYCFDDIRTAIEVAHDELVEMQNELRFTQIS